MCHQGTKLDQAEPEIEAKMTKCADTLFIYDRNLYLLSTTKNLTQINECLVSVFTRGVPAVFNLIKISKYN